ncbi:hypothetical protein AAD018_001755 [Aestuariibius insulae]|uniref:nSTAND1 domain-containing NTPase n=1 Tax=Aestuariibius insulae TaxID=2058287 RepID=UPI00345EC78C
MANRDDTSSNEQKAVATGRGSLAINAAEYANVTVYQYVTYAGDKVTVRETIDPSRCPYPGLETFRTSEAKYFAGRADDAAELEAKLRDHDICGVIAASGAGKSSLVHAGLIPVLAEREMEAWDIFAFKPGQEPLYGLARSMSGVLAEAETRKGQFDEIDATVADLRETPGRLRRYIEDIISRRASAADGKQHRVLIFVDQWEELYTRENDDDRDILVRELMDVAERGLAKVLLTMRIDFMNDLVSKSTEFYDVLEPAVLILRPLSETGRRAAIEKPAEVAGLRVPPELTSRLIADLGKDNGALPYLQFVLRQLWEMRDKEANSLTTATYDNMDGLKGAIEAHADDVFRKLSKEEQGLAKRVLPRLANVSENGITSRRLPFADFDEPARKLLRQLAETDARLIVLSSATDDVTEAEIVAEVAHEALLDDWKTLSGWIADRKDFFRLRNKLEADAKAWVENDKNPEFLISAGKPLLDAEDLLAKALPSDLSKDLDVFVSMSTEKKKQDDDAQRHADLEQLARLKAKNRGLMALAAVLILATIGAGYFWNQSILAGRDAERQRVAAETALDAEKVATELAAASAEAEMAARIDSEAAELEAQRNYISTLLEQAELAISTQDFSLAGAKVDAAVEALEALPDDFDLIATINLTRHRSENSIDEANVPREINDGRFYFSPSTQHLISVNLLTLAELEVSNGVVKTFDTRRFTRLEAHIVGTDFFFTLDEDFEGAFGATTDELSRRTFVLTQDLNQLAILNSEPPSISKVSLSALDTENIPENLSYFEYAPAVGKIILSNGKQFSLLDPNDASVHQLDLEELRLLPYHLVQDAFLSINSYSADQSRELISAIGRAVEDEEGGRSRTMSAVAQRRDFHHIPSCYTALLSFENGNTIIFDTQKNKIQRAFSFRGVPYSTFLSSDCKLALLVDELGYTELWDVDLGQPTLRLTAPTDFNAVLGFSEDNSFGVRVRNDELPNEANFLNPPFEEGDRVELSNLAQYTQVAPGKFHRIFSEANTQLYSLLPRLGFRQRRITGVESASFSEGLLLTVDEASTSPSLRVYTKELQEIDSLLLDETGADIAFLKYVPKTRRFVFLLEGNVHIFDRGISNVTRFENSGREETIELWSEAEGILATSRIFDVLINDRYFVREDNGAFVLFDLEAVDPLLTNSIVEYSTAITPEDGDFLDGYFWLLARNAEGVPGIYRFGYDSSSLEHIVSLPSDCGVSLSKIRQDLFVYHYSNDDFECSTPGTSYIQRRSNFVALEFFDGFMLDALPEQDIYLFYHSKNTSRIEARSGASSCNFNASSQPRISHLRPGKVPISSPARERISGLEGFYSGAIDSFLRQKRFVLSPPGTYIIGTDYWTVERREVATCSTTWRREFLTGQGRVDKLSHTTGSSDGEEIYVLRSNSGQMSVLQATSGQTIDNFDTFGDPRRILIDPSNQIFGFSSSYGPPHTIYTIQQGYSQIRASSD